MTSPLKNSIEINEIISSYKKLNKGKKNSDHKKSYQTSKF